MRKVLVTLVLALVAAAVAQGQTEEKKQIKDQAEYNAYIAALNTTDPAAKGAAMEAFVRQYPQSVVFGDALEQAMAAYQRASNVPKVEEMARRLQQVNPNNVNVLAILTALDRAKATQGDQASLREMCTYSQNGLQQLPSWKKPEAWSDADFQKARTQMSDILNGAAGFCALQAKDYASAQKFYKEAFRIDPTNLQDVYQLGISQLESNPINGQGLWYGAKAIQLAGSNTATVNSISPYLKAKYKKLHGKVDDYDKFLAAVAAQSAPPDDITTMVSPPPTPCDFAVQAVKENDLTQLSFGDREFVLSKANCSPANKEAADKVWKSIQDLEKGGEARLKISVKIIAATAEAIDAAISEENQQANKPDVHVVMAPAEKPLPRGAKPNVPAPGTMTDIVGVLTAYTADPFMFTMEKGALPEAPKAKPPVHHGPARRRPTR